MNSGKIKHNKIKNTGVLFELLARQLTYDVVSESANKNKTKNIIDKYFNKNSELSKEYLLYQSIIKNKFDSKELAEEFILESINSHKKLNHKKLNSLKYSLIKDIKNNLNEQEVLNLKIENYKLYASIYKLFKSKSLNESVDPYEYVVSKHTLITHLLRESQPIEEVNTKLEEFQTFDSPFRLLVLKLLAEKFNEKYKNKLNEDQRTLLRYYINESPETTKQYLKSQIPLLTKKLNNLNSYCDDKVTQIKLKEVINQLNVINTYKDITDSHIEVALSTYDLITNLEDALDYQND